AATDAAAATAARRGRGDADGGAGGLLEVVERARVDRAAVDGGHRRDRDEAAVVGGGRRHADLGDDVGGRAADGDEDALGVGADAARHRGDGGDGARERV